MVARLTVTIPAGETSVEASAFTCSGEAGETDENFVVQLSNPVDAVLSSGRTTQQAAAVILEKDVPEASARIVFIGDAVVEETDEAGVQAVFDVRLSHPADVDLTFDFTTFDGTAQAGLDYVGTAGALTVLAGETALFVRVDVLCENLFEADETFTPGVTATGDAEDLIALTLLDSVGTAVIENDDAEPALTSPSTFRLRENREAVGRITATDEDDHELVLEIVGGPDAALFSIDAERGALAFRSAPDFEAPRNVGRNNVYEIAVSASDGTNETAELLTVRITGQVEKVVAAGSNTNERFNDDRLADTIDGQGGKGNDNIDGGAGNDIIDEGKDNDRLKGGAGRDDLQFRRGDGRDVITDFELNHDDIEILKGISRFSQLDTTRRASTPSSSIPSGT